MLQQRSVNIEIRYSIFQNSNVMDMIIDIIFQHSTNRESAQYKTHDFGTGGISHISLTI